jgi:hypothetical protein
MNRSIRFAGLVLASLTISTVAMAQQGGGGRGGDGGAGGGGGGGDPSVLQLLRDDAAKKARLTRAVEPRRGAAGCISHVCNEPPPRRPPARLAQFDNACAGGDVYLVRDRQGQVIRAFCDER